MAHLIIAGTTFSAIPGGAGTQSACQPTAFVPRERKIGLTLEAADGTRNRVERAVIKRSWDITWEKTTLSTVQTVRAIQRLTTTFSLTDLEGASFTVQTEDDEFEQPFAFIDGAGVQWWTCSLRVYQH